MRIIRCENCSAVNVAGRNTCRNCESILSCEVEIDPRPAEIGFKLRIVSAIWFGLTALIPVGFFLSLFLLYANGGRWIFSLGFWVYSGLPIASAALAGYTIGSRILDPCRVKAASSATWQGLKTACAAYVVQMLAFAAIVAFATLGQPIVNVLVGAIGSFFILGFYGAIFVGWLVVLAGLVSGWVLFKISRMARFESLLFDSVRIDHRTTRKQILRAILLFLVASLPSAAIYRGYVQPYFLRESTEREYLAMMQAADGGDAKALETWLANGADPNIKVDSNDSTPIIFAVRRRRTEAVEVLLKHGADPNVSEMTNQNFTPLGTAAAMGSVEIVRVLLDYGADIEAPDDYGHTPLAKSVLAGRIDVAALLLERGADINARTVRSGNQTALSLLVHQEEISKRENLRWDPTVSPIKLHPGMVEFLEKHGALR